MKFTGKILLFIVLDMLFELNYAGNPPYYRIYPPLSHQNSPEKACIADVGPITRGQHRFLGPKCQILYCPPDPKIQEIIVIECEDYMNNTNLPEKFPDTEKRMYLRICEYCKPVSPTIDLDLMEPDSTTSLLEETIPTKPPMKPSTNRTTGINLDFFDN